MSSSDETFEAVEEKVRIRFGSVFSPNWEAKMRLDPVGVDPSDRDESTPDSLDLLRKTGWEVRSKWVFPSWDRTGPNSGGR